MKVLVHVFLILPAVWFLASCGVSTQNSARPYTVGPTTGDLVEVTPGFGRTANPLEARAQLEKSKKSRTQKKLPEDKKKDLKRPPENSDNSVTKYDRESEAPSKVTATHSFKNLSVEINLEQSEINGQKNEEAKIFVKIKGIYQRGESDSSLHISKAYRRFHSKTREDVLDSDDPNHFWAFRLVDTENRIQADIMCKKKWSCRTVIVNMYWFEGDLVFYKQYFVKNTVQLLRVETSEDPPEKEGQSDQSQEFQAPDQPTSNSDSETTDDSTEAEDYYDNGQHPINSEEEENVAPTRSEDVDHQASGEVEQGQDEDDIETHEHFGGAENYQESDFVTPFSEEYFIEDSSPDESSTEENEVSQAIANQMNSVFGDDPESGEQVYLLGDYISRILFTQLSFEYYNPNLNFRAYEVPLQALDQHDSGSLQNADRLAISYPGSIDVNIPYVLGIAKKQGFKKNWGTRGLVNLITATANQIEDDHGQKACIGNLSLERGGKVAPKSVSHQNGLDADVYFYTKVPVGEKSCVFNAARGERAHEFDVEKNYEFLKALYRNAQAEVGGRVYSYLFNIFLHENLIKKICEHAYQVDGESVDQEGAAGFEVLRRLRPENKFHHNHFHIRLNCYSQGCQDEGAAIPAHHNCRQ